MTDGAGGGGEVEAQLASLADRYALSAAAVERLGLLLGRLVEDPLVPSAIRDPRQALDQHLADSLVALEVQAVQDARVALDLGSGAGAPGLVLAVARPAATHVLLDSSARKCAFLERTAEACGFSNVQVVHERAESFAIGHGRHDVVTARAVARLDVTAEYAAPLLRLGGTLVAWAGRRSAEVEAAAGRAGAELGLSGPLVLRVQPFPEARHRHLYLMSKVRETPSRFPRRPGMALKRPLGGIPARSGLSDAPDGSSDRPRR